MDGPARGQRIARARRSRGLSQAAPTGLDGRSESWLSQVERGIRQCPNPPSCTGGLRFPIPSSAVFDTLGLDWGRVRVIPDGSSAGTRATPRDETLLKSRTADEVYVVRSGQRHWIPNPEKFTAGLSWANVHAQPETAIDLVPRSADLLAQP
jgi:hypothetical protein